MILIKIVGLLDKIYCVVARTRLKNHNFTIISNDCWGGGVYEDLQLQYTTPIVGLFFHAPCYIDFLENFNHLIHLQLLFKDESKYKEANDYRFQNNHYYPIAKLKEVEVHFLHYESVQEAISNWNRRKARINYNNLFFKFSDSNLCTPELIERFDKLPVPENNKVMFAAKKMNTVKSVVFLRHYKRKLSIGDIYNNRWAYRKNFDVVKWLNKGNRKNANVTDIV
ncbi:DUF1919 domain-containing protein [Flavobacterium olei]|uniref:DUF1919 domain-containing protein n=1 Tax=Flavobacterium olei TaxID=1886782 RepID=UPI00321B8B9B